jgi:DNA-binding MarR family transcriptional regulator
MKIPTPAPDSLASGTVPSTAQLLERIRSDWGQARPGLDPAPMLTYLLLDRLHAAMQRRVSRTYGSSGLNPATWDLLITLRRSAPPGGMTPTELSQLTAISGASMTNRVNRLLERGLIERQVSELDRRSSRIRLSARGRALADDLLPRHLENELDLFSALESSEIAMLESLAGKLLGVLEGGPLP